MKDIKNNIISLIGMTGCGKTSVGKMIAKKTGARLIDVDEEIVARHGEIKKIFAEHGEAEFRRIEYETLAEVISKTDGALTVLSCGGGLVTYEDSRRLACEKTTVIWLRRSADSVARDEKVLMRPPVNGDIENYKRLLNERYPIYRSAADYSFYNSFPQRTAREIIKKFELPTVTGRSALRNNMKGN